MAVKVYALSTCPYCKMARKFLEDNDVEFDVVEVDLLEGDERDQAVREVNEVSGGTSFPVVVSGDEHVVGYDQPAIKAMLGIDPA